MLLSYVYIYLIAKLELSLIFGQTNYTVVKFKPLCQQQTFHLDSHYHKEEKCWQLQIASL